METASVVFICDCNVDSTKKSRLGKEKEKRGESTEP